MHRRPKVALVSTGDEIIAPDQTPKPGQIRNVNQYSLRAMITEAGGETLELGVVKDDRSAFEKATAQALKVGDIVVISGGNQWVSKDMTVEIRLLVPQVRNVLSWHFDRTWESRRSLLKPPANRSWDSLGIPFPHLLCSHSLAHR